MLVAVVQVLTMPLLVVLGVLVAVAVADLLDLQVEQGAQMELQTEVTVVLDLVRSVVQVEQILEVEVEVEQVVPQA
jgi:hypothetical protein